MLNDWVASVPTPLLAVTVTVVTPPLPVGVPESTPLLRLRPIPDSVALSALLTEKVGAGNPLAEKVNEPAAPSVKVAALALVNAGASPTVSVKLCVAAAPTPLLAVTVNA